MLTTSWTMQELRMEEEEIETDSSEEESESSDEDSSAEEDESEESDAVEKAREEEVKQVERPKINARFRIGKNGRFERIEDNGPTSKVTKKKETVPERPKRKVIEVPMALKRVKMTVSTPISEGKMIS